MQRKKITALIIALALSLTCLTPAIAAPLTPIIGGMTPQWSNTSFITTGLDLWNPHGWAGGSGYAEGYSGTTQVTLVVTLYEVLPGGGLSYIASDNAAFSGNHGGMNMGRYVLTGRTYRFELVAGVYRNGSWEYTSTYSQGSN